MISDKISSALMYVPELLLHVSRGVRWDSDHVVTYSDELQAIMHEIVRETIWTAFTSAWISSMPALTASLHGRLELATR